MARLALVTGASSGIGEAYAERLAADGWDLMLVARRRDRLEGLSRRLQGKHGIVARTRESDLADTDQLTALCAEAAEMELDLLVNNAALAHYMPFAELPLETARALVELDVLAPVLLTRAVISGMVERGRGGIVNLASLLAFSGAWEGPHLPRCALYASSKSFLVTFTHLERPPTGRTDRVSPPLTAFAQLRSGRREPESARRSGPATRLAVERLGEKRSPGSARTRRRAEISDLVAGR